MCIDNVLISSERYIGHGFPIGKICRSDNRFFVFGHPLCQFGTLGIESWTHPAIWLRSYVWKIIAAIRTCIDQCGNHVIKVPKRSAGRISPMSAPSLIELPPVTIRIRPAFRHALSPSNLFRMKITKCAFICVCFPTGINDDGWLKDTYPSMKFLVMRINSRPRNAIKPDFIDLPIACEQFAELPHRIFEEHIITSLVFITFVRDSSALVGIIIVHIRKRIIRMTPITG